jgi:hypothetical protein
MLETFAIRQRNPLGKHRERSSGLLVLDERLPFSPKDRERRRMEWKTGFKAASQEIPGLHVGCRSVHCGPFWRKLRAALKAPIGVAFRYVTPDFFAP